MCVDILLAVHNGAGFLAQALESLQRQTFQNWRLVVVDDASTDSTPDILRRFAQVDGRIEIVTNERQLRLPVSLNRGLRYCKAPLVARADADDVYHPERLAKQVAYMDAHPEIGVLGSGCDHIDAYGNRIGETRHPTDDSAIRFALPFGCAFVHPSVVFRRELIAQVGGYDESMWTGQDYRLWATLLSHTQFHNLPENLISYRIHQSSITQSVARARHHDAMKLPIHRELLSRYLGSEITLDEAETLVQLVNPSYRLVPERIRSGVELCRRYMIAAQKMESTLTCAAFRSKIATGFLTQAAFQRSMDHRISRFLFHEALCLRTSTVVELRWLKLLVRIFLPRVIVDSLRSGDMSI